MRLKLIKEILEVYSSLSEVFVRNTRHRDEWL